MALISHIHNQPEPVMIQILEPVTTEAEMLEVREHLHSEFGKLEVHCCDVLRCRIAHPQVGQIIEVTKPVRTCHKADRVRIGNPDDDNVLPPGQYQVIDWEGGIASHRITLVTATGREFFIFCGYAEESMLDWRGVVKP